MAITLTTVLKNMNEDLGDTISNLAPSATPVFTGIDKTKASQTYHEVITDTLNTPNANNARAEGADAVVPTNTQVSRVGNFTQIFAKEVFLSGSADAAKTAGKAEFARQMANVMKEIKTDIEASIVTNNASASGGTRKSAGMESWIKTNAVENGSSATPGFSANLVAAPTDAGTAVLLSEAMVLTLAQNMFNAGATIDTAIVNPVIKAKLSSLLQGNASRWNNAKEKSSTAAIDFYATDFGEFKIQPHRMVRTSVVIAYDPSLWAWASFRPFKATDLGVSGDARKVQLLTEGTLECRNEVGNGKIAGIKAA